MNEASHWRRPLASARRSRRAEEINERSVAELRKGFDDFLLAVDNLPQKTDPVYVACLVPGCFHQNAGLVLGRDGDAVRGLRKSLAVELANFLGDVLDEIDCRVALDTIVVTSIVEPLFELLGELLHGGDWRIDGKADMTAHAVGRSGGKINHFLAKQRRLADQRFVDPLLLGFTQK